MDRKKNCGVFKSKEKKNEDLVADANMIVADVEGYTPKERSERKKELKKAFEEKGASSVKTSTSKGASVKNK